MATEGSSLPSLKQLDDAVREYLIEYPDDIVTVVVDATFGHRIPPEERNRFEEAESGGEIVSPPAGAIGRGDAFLLRVADKVGAVVLSNDSFQEFHGEYEWLFDKGRLIGGKPVPGVGWIFTPRTPVRGPKSRESVKEAKRKRHAERAEEPTESGLDMAAERSRGHGGDRKLQRAIAAAVEEAVEPAKGGRKRRRRRRGGEVPSEPLNEPFNFITFIAAHQLADEVEGTVDEFSSHGAFISVDGARCYLPLSAMGEVAPRSAREVLRKGERRTFVVQAFDAMRRGIELALPGFARPAGTPTAETIDAEIHHGEGADEISGALQPVGAETQSGATRARQPARRGSPRPAKKLAPALETATEDGARPRRPATKPEAPSIKAVGGTKAGAAAKALSGRGPAAKSASGRARTATDTSVGGETADGRQAARPAPTKARVAAPGAPVKKPTAKSQPAKDQPVAKLPSKASGARTAAARTSVAGAPAAKAPATKAPAARARAATVPVARAPAAKTPATKAPAKKAPAKKAPATRAATAKAATAKAPAGANAKKSAAAGQVRTATSATSKTSSPRVARGPARAAGTTSDKASAPIAAKKSRATSVASTKKATATNPPATKSS
jgi:hypothetical protein